MLTNQAMNRQKGFHFKVVKVISPLSFISFLCKKGRDFKTVDESTIIVTK